MYVRYNGGVETPTGCWTDAELAEAVASETTLRGVARRLGYVGRSKKITERIVHLNLDTSHFLGSGWARGTRRGTREPDARPTGRPRKWSDADLADAVASEPSIAGVIRRLGFQPSGGMYQLITHHVGRLNLDTSHMTGQGWARGTRGITSHAQPLEDVLVKGSTYYNAGKLRQRLIAAGLKQARCEECGLNEWRRRSLPLELDHINGDRSDNRLENLRILCPNCHSQTETWCRAKKRPA